MSETKRAQSRRFNPGNARSVPPVDLVGCDRQAHPKRLIPTTLAGDIEWKQRDYLDLVRKSDKLIESAFGPSVWTGRALQAENDDLEKLVLRFCIRPIDGAFELLAIMDIRARSISFATRPRRPYGPPDHERAGETFSPSPLSDSQTSAGKPTHCFRDQLEPSAIPLVNLSVFIRLLPCVMRAS